MEKLIFATAGIPNKTAPRTYKKAFDDLNEMGLGALEIEFVHGVKMHKDNQADVIKFAPEQNITLTAHGPYYINLNAKEEEKVDASVGRILDTARMLDYLGGYSVVFHAAFYLGDDKETAYKKVRNGFERIQTAVSEEGLKVWIRPETTGKATQWGDLDEVIRISNEFENVLPCIDFSHLHARYNGEYNSYDEFAYVFDKIGTKIGSYALENFHAHIAGIEYSPKGEKNHLNLEESDFNYKDLIKAFKAFDVKGVVVCESPNIEDDAVLLMEYYNSL